MTKITDFITKYKKSKRTKNFVEIISRYMEMLRGYYFVVNGFIPSDEEIRHKAIEIFSQKKASGYFNELNEPVNQGALTLERKNNILFFSPKKEAKCQKT